MLWHICVEGEVSRDRENTARRFVDEHGHWADE
jgi:hypothetical protein